MHDPTLTLVYLVFTLPSIFLFQNLAPKWIIYTLTSMYWRVHRNNVFALHCLIDAEQQINDHSYRDLVLVSLSSVLLETGFVDDALDAVVEATTINSFEVRTFYEEFYEPTI